MLKWVLTAFAGFKYGEKVKKIVEFLFEAFNLIQDGIRSKQAGKELDLIGIGSFLHKNFVINTYSSKPIETQFVVYLLYYVVEYCLSLFNKDERIDIKKAIDAIKQLEAKIL